MRHSLPFHWNVEVRTADKISPTINNFCFCLIKAQSGAHSLVNWKTKTNQHWNRWRYISQKVFCIFPPFSFHFSVRQFNTIEINAWIYSSHEKLFHSLWQTSIGVNFIHINQKGRKLCVFSPYFFFLCHYNFNLMHVLWQRLP